MPPAVSGYPIQFRIQSTTTSSNWLAPLAVSQVAAFRLKPAQRKSATTPGHVGEVGTKPKHLG